MWLAALVQSEGIWQWILLALAMALARLLHRLPLLRRMQLPDSLLAGLLLAVLYNVSAHVWGYNLPKNLLKPLVSHLLNIFYIALALKSVSSIPPKPKRSERSSAASEAGRRRTQHRGDLRGTVLFILWHYGMQAAIGLSGALLLRWSKYPDLLPAVGLFVPLGYALGPAQGYEIGRRWQDAQGLNLGDLGLFFGALGYVWAALGGLLVLNLFAKKYKKDSAYSGQQMAGAMLPLPQQTSQGKEENCYSASLVRILLCYGLALLFLELLSEIFISIKTLWGLDLSGLMDTLRSIRFVFCALAALCFVRLLRCFRTFRLRFCSSPKREAAINWWKRREQHEGQSLNHLANVFVDVMVSAGIGSISFALVWRYIGVIAILAASSVLLLAPLHFLLARSYFRNERLERSLVIYGGMMGTTSTGMALLGTLDPYYQSLAARDYLLATGFAFLGLLPVIVSLQWITAGNYHLALLLYAAYALFCSALIVRRIRCNRRRIRP